MIYYKHRFSGRFASWGSSLLLVLGLAACSPQGEPLAALEQEAEQPQEHCTSNQQQVGDDVNHGILATYGPLREQGPSPAHQQSDDGTDHQSTATHDPLHYEMPVPSGLSYTNCSRSNQQSDHELELDLEVLRPDERLGELGSSCVNQPIQDWLNNAPIFNTSVLMHSLLQLLQRLEELIDELTGRSC